MTSFEIQETLFPTPQGNVKGTLIALVTLSSGKTRRVGHAYLYLPHRPDEKLSIDIPKAVPSKDLAVVITALTAFSERYSSHSKIS
ncbi:hypothetical protein GCM10019059_36830 [Camelimonas fluminis]|uniref:Uncharacterized protein n=1 Tax=Camelimonas fluminis TaxID=1576911 RepID=A0ABV7UIA6_9HYPH|nr:hypothetical protein [Camelimonas fluminis]GHE73908.1 hypothetical protein GCM10019059_36830 [Camelimonas fluminis]